MHASGAMTPQNHPLDLLKTHYYETLMVVSIVANDG